jgi:DNA-binding response OmpR family regulator
MKITFFQGNVETHIHPSRSPVVKTKPLILLVEDAPLLQFLHQEFLKPIACDVVSTKAEALFKASSHRYDLILMDLGLPDTNGIEVIQQLRKETQNQKTPVVILTTQTLDFFSKRKLNPVAQVICKPVNCQTLKKLVSQFIK